VDEVKIMKRETSEQNKREGSGERGCNEKKGMGDGKLKEGLFIKRKTLGHRKEKKAPGEENNFQTEIEK